MPVQRRTPIYGILLMASQVAMVGWLAPLASGAIGKTGAGTQFRVIMASGQQAPGTSEGVEFFNLSISHDDSPRINNQGAVLFPARLTGEGIDASNDGTYYLHNGHSSTLIAREGDQAAGQNPGIFYGGFVNRDLNLSDQGQVVFNAQLTGVGVNEVNDRALFYANQGSVVPIARIGTSVPDPSLRRYYLTRSFTDVQFDAMGRVYYGAGLGIGPVVQEYGPPQAIYRFDEGETSLTVTRATSSPVALESFPEFAVSGDGEVSLLAVLDLPFGNGRRDTQILELNGSSLTSIVREEQRPPGYPRFTEFGQPSIGTPFADITRNTAGVTVFTSWLFGDFGWNGLRHSIWMHDPDQDQPLREVVSVTSPLPNHPNFVVSDIHSDSGIQSLQLNEAGHLAFFAKLYDPVEGGDSQWALLVDRGDGLDWVYKQGDPVPHLPEGTRFASGSFFRETGFQMNELGQIAFAANYWNPNGESGRGLFLAQPDGQIISILQTGDQLELAPGDFREVASFDHFSDISPSSGFARSLNDRGELAILVRFTDNSTAILVASVPEPAQLALISAVALLGGVWLRRTRRLSAI